SPAGYVWHGIDVGSHHLDELADAALVVPEVVELGAEDHRGVGLAPSRAQLEGRKYLCLRIGRAAHQGEHRPSRAGPPRVAGLPQLAREPLALDEGALRAADVARLDEGARAMDRGMPGELAAADLTCQRRQLAREREPVGERERVVHGEKAQDEHLRQPGPVPEPPRNVDRLACERVAPLAMGGVDELARELAEQ